MYTPRERWEEIEDAILAPWGFRSRNSRGRLMPEPEHLYRSAFQRDRDRIIHTTAFRRLEYKTQVFIIYEGDYYRTRLTHTIEVAQIGRTLARALGANEDLTEAIALAHDLGHTPFGHSGEETLNELMAKHGGFNHNEQSLRIVEFLEQRYPNFRGLNLTWEVREGIIKHETRYDQARISGYDPHLSATLEAQIVNLADEIAYNTHDLDDGLRAGLLAVDDVAPLQLWQRVKQSIGWTNGPFSDLIRHRMIRRLIGIEVSDVATETYRRLQEANIRSPADVQAYPGLLVGCSKDLEEQNHELKDFLLNHLYRHPRVMRMAAKARRLITELFHAYVTDPRQLPLPVQRQIQEQGLERTVCDYIAGMTDRYAIEEYRRLDSLARA